MLQNGRQIPGSQPCNLWFETISRVKTSEKEGVVNSMLEKGIVIVILCVRFRGALVLRCRILEE
jgi:hypothetical protein